MRQFLKWFGVPALFVAVVFLTSEDGQGQPPRGGFGGGPPGGGGFGGGMSRDPDAMWNMMSKGQDRINLNDPANSWMKSMRERRGQPIPPDGIITKEMFKTEYAQQQAQGGGFGKERGGFGGGGPGGRERGAFGGPPGSFGATPGSPTVMVQGAPGSPPMTFQPGQSGPGGSPGGMDPDLIFKAMDRNGDGRISQDEMSGRMRERFAQFDANRDGALDANESRMYMQSQMQGRGGDRDRNQFSGPGGSGGFGGPGGPGGFGGPMGGQYPQGYQPGFGGPMPGGGGESGREDRRRRGDDDEDSRPVVHRYGKLPKELPSWFEEYDTDKDGMVGLYEWRKHRKSEDFVPMDLNGDCYLTADEWLHYTKLLIEKKHDEGSYDEEGNERPNVTRFPSGGGGGGAMKMEFKMPGPGGGSGRDKGGPPQGNFPKKGDFKGKRDEKGNEKGGKRNPFTGG